MGRGGARGDVEGGARSFGRSPWGGGTVNVTNTGRSAILVVPAGMAYGTATVGIRSVCSVRMTPWSWWSGATSSKTSSPATPWLWDGRPVASAARIRSSRQDNNLWDDDRRIVGLWSVGRVESTRDSLKAQNRSNRFAASHPCRPTRLRRILSEDYAALQKSLFHRGAEGHGPPSLPGLRSPYSLGGGYTSAPKPDSKSPTRPECLGTRVTRTRTR